jgi:phenylpropionate dioxygenase-like ring-hydroxylating dioxygenase large terminal subunit
MMSLTKRMLDLMDRQATDLAPNLMREPTSAYTSQERLERERLMIFGRTPMFLGLSADIPTPGSWRALDIVDTPMLMCRDESGAVQLFLNSCRHRGVKLCEGSGSENRNFTCPFHGWRYDLRGNLKGVPEPEGFDELVRENYGLVRLPVAEKYGMIWGAPLPGGDLDVDDVLCGLGPELREWGFEKFSLYTEHHLHHFRGNWKFAWATFCENYHFAFLHQKTLSDYLVSRRQAINLYGPHARMVSALRSIEEMRKLPEDEWDPGRNITIQYRLYPAVNFSVYPEKLEVHWVFPGRRPDEGYGIHAVYVKGMPETDEERKQLDAAVWFGCETIVNGEDYWVTGQSEPGLRAPATPGHVVIGRNEPVVQHFHSRFREAIGER